MSQINFEHLIKEVIDQTNTVATTQVQKKAQSKGWPMNYARSISVDITSEEMIHMADEAQDLEYGSLSSAPNPAVRALEDDLLPKTFTTVVRAAFAKKGLVI